MRESEFWTKLRLTLPGYIRRVENTVGRGTPDVFWLWEGHAAWVELKVDSGKGTLLRPEQYATGRNIHINGGSIWIVSFHAKSKKILTFPWGYSIKSVNPSNPRCRITSPPSHSFPMKERTQLTHIIHGQ